MEGYFLQKRKREISAESLGGKPSDSAWGRDSSGTYFHAESLYLLQSGVPLFSTGPLREKEEIWERFWE